MKKFESEKKKNRKIRFEKNLFFWKLQVPKSSKTEFYQITHSNSDEAHL